MTTMTTTMRSARTSMPATDRRSSASSSRTSLSGMAATGTGDLDMAADVRPLADSNTPSTGSRSNRSSRSSRSSSTSTGSRTSSTFANESSNTNSSTPVNSSSSRNTAANASKILSNSRSHTSSFKPSTDPASVLQKPLTPRQTPSKEQYTLVELLDQSDRDDAQIPSLDQQNSRSTADLTKYAILEEQHLQLIDTNAKLQKRSDDRGAEIERLKTQADAAEIQKADLQDALEEMEKKLSHALRDVTLLTADLDNGNMRLITERSASKATELELGNKVAELTHQLDRLKESMPLAEESSLSNMGENHHHGDEDSDTAVHSLKRQLADTKTAAADAFHQIEIGHEKINELSEQLSLKDQSNKQLQHDLEILSLQLGSLQEQNEAFIHSMESRDIDIAVSPTLADNSSFPPSHIEKSRCDSPAERLADKSGLERASSSMSHPILGTRQGHTLSLENELAGMDINIKLTLELNRLHSDNLTLVQSLMTSLESSAIKGVSK
ncbi:hypothetical protein BASA60_009809 [Batrachochytrium salamandrivorans]|nr:hypothetical protein BASA60_009809 [Batrachochytrium salamandrivorans]